MGTLWLILTLIIWVAGAIYPGYNPEKFQYSSIHRKGEYDWGELGPYAGIVFVAGLFSVPVVGLALAVGAFAGPAYGLFKLGQKLRARRELKDMADA